MGEPGLSKKSLVSVPAHVAREAAEARARYIAKKGESSKKETGNTESPRRGGDSSSSTAWRTMEPEETPALESASAAAISASEHCVADADVPDVVAPTRLGRWGHGSRGTGPRFSGAALPASPNDG